MTCYDLLEMVARQYRQHGTATPVCIETMEPTGDGLNLEEVYHDVESVESIVTPSGRRVIVLRT